MEDYIRHRLRRINELLEQREWNIDILHDAVTLLNHELHPNQQLVSDYDRLQEMHQRALDDLAIDNNGYERSRISRYVRTQTRRMIQTIELQIQESESRILSDLTNRNGLLRGNSRLHAFAQIGNGEALAPSLGHEQDEDLPLGPPPMGLEYEHNTPGFHGMRRRNSPKLKKTCIALHRTWVKRSKNKKGFCRKSHNKK